MRLIDVGNFINNLRLLLNRSSLGEISPRESISIGEIATLIKNEPTAYDVDKVMERLEELASCEESRAAEYDEAGKIDRMNIHDGKAAAYKNTIRIIKSGGVE